MTINIRPFTDIRPFEESDRAAITAFQNERLPKHLHETVAEWERADARKPAGEVGLRLCAVAPETGQPIAYLNAVDRGTSAWCKPGVCSFGLWVAPEHQRQGIGSALYERMLEFARQRALGRVGTFVRFCLPGAPAVRFLEKRGFAEVDRTVPVMLDLTAFSREQFALPAPAGIRFLSYADAGDSERSRRRLYALMTKLDRDIPTNDVRSEPPPFEQFVKDLDTPEWASDALALAADGDEWIGLSQLGFQEGTNIAWTFLTGVLPKYRSRGIAFALKLQAIDAAIARGCPLILTENHEDNAPMRAVNKKLGFVLDAPDISYGKEL